MKGRLPRERETTTTGDNMKQARNANVGRETMGTAVAKSGVAPRSLGTSAMNQARDSGGKIVNPDQKIKSNSLAAAKSVPVTGSGAPPNHAQAPQQAQNRRSLGTPPKTARVGDPGSPPRHANPARVGDPGAGRIQEGYPGMNVAAAHTTFNSLGGKVGKKVAGGPKFYGR
jgi:hypothetical protein